MRIILFYIVFASVSLTSTAQDFPAHGICHRYKMVDTTSAMKESSTTPADATPRCDETAGFNPPGENHEWFRLQGPGGTGITNYHPQRTGICGTTFPGWIQGKLPNSHFGMRIGRLCYNNPPPGFTCPEKFDCHDHIEVDMYNCGGRYFLYHLHVPLNPTSCAKAFCTVDIGPCELGTYTTVTTLPKMTVTHRLKAGSEPCCDESTNYVDGVTWIRLQGSSGTEIINEQPTSGTGVCGTTNAGWIIGSKPTQVGIAARRRLCYSKDAEGECSDERPIDVMNCKSFMLYRLHPSTSLSQPSPSPCAKAFCVENPVYDICDPRYYRTIYSPSAGSRQSDEEYADERTWWLIEGSHGVRVISITKPLRTGQCRSDNPGWMEGTVPSPSDGIVQRKLCYFDGSSTACPHPRNIDVANCGSFLLYRFYEASTPARAKFCIDPLPPNPCYYLPCQRGGTCTGHDNNACYKCTCPSGLSGKNCETGGTDECASNPCQNGGTCHSRIGSYSCVCATGYTGANCETEIDKCTPDPCQNGGKCIKKGDSYICECTDQYTGNKCETREKDKCDPNPCKNFGECEEGVCKCKFGWTGVTCEDDSEIVEIFNGIEVYYDDDDGGNDGCGFWCWLGGLLGGIFGALVALLPALLALGSSVVGGIGGAVGGAAGGAVGAAGGGLAAALGALFGAAGTATALGTSLNTFNNGNNPSNPNTRCPRMNAGSGLQGMKSGYDKCKKKYESKQCTIREKAKPEKPQQPEQPKPTEQPSTPEQPTEAPTTEPTEEPTSACSATCSAVQDPEHGQKIGDKTSCGDSVRFNCDSGYKLSGCTEPQCKITCQHDGQWSSQPPTCVKAACGDLVTLSSSSSSHEIEKTASSSTTDCNWAVVSDTPAAITLSFITFNFPNSISAEGSCENYIEVVMGTRREKYCGEKPENDVTMTNGGLIRFHSSSPSTSFKINLSIQTSCPVGLSKRAGGCTCTVSSTSTAWPDHLPILYDVHNKIKLPTKNGVLSLNQGETLQARCTNTEFLSYPGGDEVTIECDNGGKLKVILPPKAGVPSVTESGKSFKDISCKGKVLPEMWEDSNKLHIGWKKNTISQIIITYDNPKRRPLYVEHTIFGPIALWKEKNDGKRPPFKGLESYLKNKIPVPDINRLKASYEDVNQDGYAAKKQHSILETVNAGLGKYIDCCEGARFLVRGHMSPNADFGFQSWRDATFFMVNVAAQWQGINAGNWFYLEDEIRNYAYERDTNIKVYTGAYGELELDGYNINIPQANSPVPTHFWKIVHDEGLKAAVAFVALNNPYYAALDAENYPAVADRICPTQCDYLDKGQTLEKGIIMCCSYNDLKGKLLAANVPNLPGPPTNLYDSTVKAAQDFGTRLKTRIR